MSFKKERNLSALELTYELSSGFTCKEAVYCQGSHEYTALVNMYRLLWVLFSWFLLFVLVLLLSSSSSDVIVLVKSSLLFCLCFHYLFQHNVFLILHQDSTSSAKSVKTLLSSSRGKKGKSWTNQLVQIWHHCLYLYCFCLCILNVKILSSMDGCSTRRCGRFNLKSLGLNPI